MQKKNKSSTKMYCVFLWGCILCNGVMFEGALKEEQIKNIQLQSATACKEIFVIK